ncbi:hypothetical protein JKP88DRAFT_221373 [Tribonema minus]|uniref:Uncharacterized protein n=1 Tax=Tribonema minus TaxID=303371 RepID=A0A836CE05_9STRA|nr:hypothetical protein JKP88DRAFT_221373 [Tribonema minus]
MQSACGHATAACLWCAAAVVCVVLVAQPAAAFTAPLLTRWQQHPTRQTCSSRSHHCHSPLQRRPLTSTAEDLDDILAEPATVEETVIEVAEPGKRKRGRPRKAETEAAAAAAGELLPKPRKRKSKKAQQFSFLQPGEQPHPDCRAHLAIVHTGSDEDCQTVSGLRVLLADRFGDVVNVYDEAYDKEASRLFEMWLEGPNIVRLYSRQGQLDGDLDDAAMERIMATVEEEVSDIALHTYGPF